MWEGERSTGDSTCCERKRQKVSFNARVASLVQSASRRGVCRTIAARSSDASAADHASGSNANGRPPPLYFLTYTPNPLEETIWRTHGAGSLGSRLRGMLSGMAEEGELGRRVG